MAEQVIGFTALAGLAFALLLFLLRWFYWVTPRSAAFGPVMWTFFWTLAVSSLLGDVFLAGQAVPLMQGAADDARRGRLEVGDGCGCRICRFRT